ncbi:Serine phosphatase RsbU, regulator of sigma subunit [Richelia intracellularis HH01]|uniref:Serine phosphatase RsbU, regulator of sigma subunit n=1 Tax=Richelia intracellularis HH01 TaxID=1165094 RepID=M1X5F7_9NOST|nr:PP2C family protein-serine/threonine phosphatase [Richelia intracellularis]CCH67296.1 Serine phosphatase RsbU, regulator of sigma subunit [Richelia intracellularis HH01]
MQVSQVPSQPTDSNSSSANDVTPIVALKELVARLHREQNKIQDLLSSLGFALRSFNNLNQFLELIPLMATRVTDADGSALFIYKPNGQVRLEQLHWQNSRQRKNIRKALETASSKIKLLPNSNNTHNSNSIGILDDQMHHYLGPDMQIFGTAILVKHKERGWLYVLSSHSEYSWTETRQKLVRLVADQTAVAIENDELAVELREKERLDQELEIGAEIQRRLFPRQCPSIPSITIAARCKPANRVGGDYYDFIPTSNNHITSSLSKNKDNGKWALVIGDVMGKGVPAGLIMTMMRGMLRGEVLHSHTPARILQNLNRVMYVDLENSNRFVTLFYSEYDPNSRTLYYSNAAHNPPLWWHANTKTVSRLDTLGMLIGLDVQSQYEDAQAHLEPGDTIIYYTDGLTDAAAADGNRFDEENLISHLSFACRYCSSTQEILDYLFDQVQKFIGANKQSNDDMTLVVLQVR